MSVPSRTGRFATPRQRRSVLDRPRLTARLHAAVGNGLTLVSAPAGFGKTTLLASFTAQLDFDVRWLTLDGSCAAPEVFAQHLATLFAGEPCEPPATAEKLDDLRAFVHAAMARACDQSDSPLLLVLDNIHEIADSTDASEVLGWLIEALPEGNEVILSGRDLPPLTIIDQLIATGECLLLESGDLAFTHDEIAALTAMSSADTSPGELLAATGGWPAGVMAGLAGSLPLNGRVTRAGAAWERYLASEVWQAVPGPVQDALLSLAVAPILTPAIATALAGDDGWARASSWLERNDYLCEAFDHGALRLNPLFRSFLEQRARATRHQRYTRDAARAVAVLEQAGQLSDALELARTAELTDELARLLTRHHRELLHGGQFALLKRAHSALPLSVYDEDPLLRALRARVLAHTGRPAEALDEAAAATADATSVEIRVHALLARLRALRLLGRTSELPPVFDALHALGPLEDPGLAAEVAYHEAQWVLPSSSDFMRAEALLRKSVATSKEAATPTIELLARSTLGQLLAMRGDCPAAVNELTRAAAGWRSRGRTSNLGWVLNNLGMAHLTVGDFEAASATLAEAVDEARACENSRNLAYATASLADARVAAGDYASARQLYEKSIELCSNEVPDETLAALSIAGLASAHLGLGDIQQADYFAERALYIVESVGAPFELGTCLMVDAAIRSAAGRHRDALESARRAVAVFEEIGADAPLRQAYYRVAMCAFKAGDRAAALEAATALAGLVPEPWMLGSLIPLLREQPMFGQWLGARGLLGEPFNDLLQAQTFAPTSSDEEAASTSRFPRIAAESLGVLRVLVDGREVADEEWASSKSKELFYLFLARRDGIRKEEAVEQLYPELEPEKCNSAFHSNLYRVRKALYHDSVVKKNGAYMLNPEGEFTWDVELFERALAEAQQQPKGSEQRARLYEEALRLYRGPFAEAFYSEWAESIRHRTATRALAALSTLAGFYAGREDYEEAARCLEKIVAQGEPNEEVAYQLATYRSRAGQPAAALAFLDSYARTQREEYGVELPARFRELRQRIASGIAV
jgi:LuxR family maltose regulon positive regulatory protein